MAPRSLSVRKTPRGQHGPILTGLAILVGLAGAPSVAVADQPSSGDLVLAGLAMAPPVYVLGVAAHEGSHALAAWMVGADVEGICLLPGRDPATGAFYFGRTRVRGLRGSGARSFFLLAPKLTDLLMLGGYTALLAADALPANRYGALAVVVVGTGFWVDFSKDVLRFSRYNDVVKFYDQHGWTSEWSRLPWRLGHAALGVATGLALYAGYRQVFDRDADDGDGDGEVGATAAGGLVVSLVGGRF